MQSDCTITATNITVTDTIPQLTTFYSANNNGQLTDDMVTWQIPSLPPNSYFQMQLIVEPLAIFTEPTAIINGRYGAQSEGGYSTIGSPVISLFNAQKTYLPVIQK